MSIIIDILTKANLIEIQAQSDKFLSYTSSKEKRFLQKMLDLAKRIYIIIHAFCSKILL